MSLPIVTASWNVLHYDNSLKIVQYTPTHPCWCLVQALVTANEFLLVFNDICVIIIRIICLTPSVASVEELPLAEAAKVALTAFAEAMSALEQEAQS